MRTLSFAYPTQRLAFTLAALLMALPLPPALALDAGISISSEHSNNLGVVLGKPMPAPQIPVLSAPAKIVVPAAKEYVVSTSQAGLIMHLEAAIGDKVKQGDVLATINSPDLLSAQLLFLKATNELMLGEMAYQRDQKLFNEGVIPERRWQETRSQHTALVSDANERQQLLEIAGMGRGEIEQLKKTRHLSGLLSVRSPITGVVLERMVVAGARIDTLTPLYRIANLDELWLEINIPQERIGQIKIGDKVLLEKAIANGQGTDAHKAAETLPASASISLLGQSVNPENQTILARAILKSVPPGIRPGQRINIQIIEANPKPAFTVPNSAVAQQDGQAFLFVKTKDGFRANPVTVIGKQADETIIGGGVDGSETIAVQGAAALKATWLGLGSKE